MANEKDEIPTTDDLEVDQLDTLAGGTGHGEVQQSAAAYLCAAKTTERPK
jgi:hypothetical protein